MDIDLSSTQRLLSYFPGLTSLMNLAEKEPSPKKWPQGHLWVINRVIRKIGMSFFVRTRQNISFSNKNLKEERYLTIFKVGLANTQGLWEYYYGAECPDNLSVYLNTEGEVLKGFIRSLIFVVHSDLEQIFASNSKDKYPLDFISYLEVVHDGFTTLKKGEVIHKAKNLSPSTPPAFPKQSSHKEDINFLPESLVLPSRNGEDSSILLLPKNKAKNDEVRRVQMRQEMRTLVGQFTLPEDRGN